MEVQAQQPEQAEIFRLEALKWCHTTIAALTILQGARVCISGPSGIGKTTFLQLFNRMHDATGGKLAYKGKLIQTCHPEQLRREVVMNPQRTTVIGPTIEAELTLFARLHHLSLPTSSQMHQLLEELQLAYPLTHPVKQLSGGEQQRLTLARTLLTQAPVMLLDEPTSALDPASEQALIRCLQAPRFAHQTFIIVSHSPTFVAAMATQHIQLGLEEVTWER